MGQDQTARTVQSDLDLCRPQKAIDFIFDPEKGRNRPLISIVYKSEVESKQVTVLENISDFRHIAVGTPRE